MLDFANKTEDIKKAFDNYYKGTILSGETDINKLNDLTDTLEEFEIYNDEILDEFIRLFLGNQDRAYIENIVDRAVSKFKEMELDDRIEFKASSKSFVRTYNFLSVLMPESNLYWEKLNIFLTSLLPKLPKIESEDFSHELYSDIDLESYRLQVKENMRIYLANEDVNLNPVPVQTDVGIPVPELDKLSSILDDFHKRWGTEFTDEDRIMADIKALNDEVKKDEVYKNAVLYSDEQNAKDEVENLIGNIISQKVTSNVEMYKAFNSDIKNNLNQSFKTWLVDCVFDNTYNFLKQELGTR